uniref:Uncharacterized protein n=1 Tax=Pithovirus LCPAC202 TaxID=2506592 RepID=A0A481Z5V2_9VIRU|nr:MAG: hypothetical protein LCPAC202_02120 [Pithovirus LCPAC202]
MMEARKVILKIEALPESGWTGPKIYQEKLFKFYQAESVISQWHGLLGCQQPDCLKNGENHKYSGDVINYSSQRSFPIYHQSKSDPFTIQFRYLKLKIIDDLEMVRAFEVLYPKGKTGSFDLDSAISLQYPKCRTFEVSTFRRILPIAHLCIGPNPLDDGNSSSVQL